MDVLQSGNAVLLVWHRADADRIKKLAGEITERTGRAPRVECAERLAGALDAAAFDAAVLADGDSDASLLAEVLKVLKPCGVLVLLGVSDPTSSTSLITLHGFVDIITNKSDIVAHKPNFEPGARRTLRGAQWRLQEDDDIAAAWGAPANDQELVKDSDLLDADNLKKPAATELRVCASTGVRRACADCSCGLAEELAGETKKKPAGTSSCGSCYLGDAFRCSTCPYLGMPAFQPGEKVMLADLRSDL